MVSGSRRRGLVAPGKALVGAPVYGSGGPKRRCAGEAGRCPPGPIESCQPDAASATITSQRRVRTMNQEQFAKIKSGRGFIAALDQSGGSTPKALALYGIPESAYS